MKVSSRHSAWVGQLKSCSMYWVIDTLKWHCEISMLRLIPPHCEAGGHPGSLYASNAVTKLKKPYSNTTMGPYKARGELFCLYPILSKEAFPRQTHQIAFHISSSCSRDSKWNLHHLPFGKNIKSVNCAFSSRYSPGKMEIALPSLGAEPKKESGRCRGRKGM